MSKLIPLAPVSAGSFVKSSQTMAASQGFSCVSQSWFDKTMSLDDGLAKLDEGKKTREDIMTKWSDVSPILNGRGFIAFKTADGREFLPTEHAALQVCTFADVPHTFWKKLCSDESDEKDRETFLVCIKNGWRKRRGDSQMRLRTYGDGTLRACLSSQYSPIDNAWYLEVMKAIFKRIGVTEPRLSHFKSDCADTMMGNILIPDTCRVENDSDYGGLISFSNCEIGKLRLDQYPSVFRAICMNGCIWGRTDGSIISQVHRGKINLKKLAVTLYKNVDSQIPLLGGGIDLLLKTKTKSFNREDVMAVFAELADTYRMSKELVGSVTQAYTTFGGANLNLFGVIDAVTRAGQEHGMETWRKCDEIGGELATLSDASFDRFLNRARNLTKDDIKKALFLAA